MTSHADASVPPVPHEFPNLLGYIMGPAARAQTAYTLELTPFRRLLARGATQLRLFVVTRGGTTRRARPGTGRRDARSAPGVS
jgi:hypothetical protein